MKIYFAGSIRAGRDNVDRYRQIISALSQYGTVLTEHIADSNLTMVGETYSEEYIYNRDMEWLSSADVVVADVSIPSLGVGFEIAKAIDLKKKLLCLYDKNADRKLSAMIAGAPGIKVFEYNNIDEIRSKIANFFK